MPREDARLANPLFAPTSGDFVFDAPQVTGTIQTPDFSADKLSRPPYRLAYALEEYSARWHRSNASRPACYWRNGAAVSAAGAQVAIDIPVDRDLVRCNRAFTLRMEIFDGRGLRVAESTATVGVKGWDNVYRPKKGAKLTWQEVCASGGAAQYGRLSGRLRAHAPAGTLPAAGRARRAHGRHRGRHAERRHGGRTRDRRPPKRGRGTSGERVLDLDELLRLAARQLLEPPRASWGIDSRGTTERSSQSPCLRFSV